VTDVGQNTRRNGTRPRADKSKDHEPQGAGYSNPLYLAEVLSVRRVRLAWSGNQPTDRRRERGPAGWSL